MTLKRGFTDPAFTAGGKSEWDRALDIVALAVINGQRAFVAIEPLTWDKVSEKEKQMALAQAGAALLALCETFDVNAHKSIEEKLAKERDELGNYRGRRLVACQAVDKLHAVVEAIDRDDGSQLPIPGRTMPGPLQEAMRNELFNAVALTLRLILTANDGGCSPQRLPRF